MAKVNADSWKQEAPPGSLACEKGGLDFKAECSTFSHPIHKGWAWRADRPPEAVTVQGYCQLAEHEAEMLLFGRLDFQQGRAAAIVGLWCAYRALGEG